MDQYYYAFERNWSVQSAEEQQEKFFENLSFIVILVITMCVLESIISVANNKLIN